MILEIRHLRVVEAVSREGSVTRAAVRLHLTQPAVSHALKGLEDRLGVSLFRREDRRMLPTAEGQRLLRAAGTVLEEVRRAEFDVEQMRTGHQGVVRIATECYTCYSWLPSLLAKFGDRFPDVALTIAPEERADPIGGLLNERLDLAIMSTLPRANDIACTKLFQDEMVAVVPRNHSWAKRTSVSALDFENEHLINHGPLETTTIYQDILHPAGVSPRRCTTLPLTEAIIQAVRSGVGISVLARWLVAPEIEAGSLRGVRIGRRGLKRTWYAAVRDFRAGSPVIQRLIRELGKHGYAAACECGVQTG
jgi:LysR family transcriptional regulator for metE and metH